MKILVTGNMGYVGPGVVRRLRDSHPHATIVGFDMGYFGHCMTAAELFPESRTDVQYVGDVRRPLSKDVLTGVDVVVHLAAISNDPMGNTFEAITDHVNHRASVEVAAQAKAAGARAFVFASSCSVYGCADGGPRTEESPVGPLTAYARSKAAAEQGLARLADESFTVTSLRFATACGMSDRLRLDLVLNDFIASAVASKRITILSDGTPWRPLIHVSDMARAIDWAIQRPGFESGAFLAVNAGSDEWNYQVKELAETAALLIGGVNVSLTHTAPPDKRSYRVSFAKFKQLAPAFQPHMTLHDTITELRNGLEAMHFNDAAFRTSNLMRLEVLKELRRHGHLTESLAWAHCHADVDTATAIDADAAAPLAVGWR
jgi:nucleoside-diphosphate-sugar epimerase